MTIKMKQNKNSSVVFRSFCVLVSLVVFVFSISIPAFAYTDTSTNNVDFSDQPYGYGDVGSSFDSRTQYGNSSGNGFWITSAAGSNKFYAFTVHGQNSSIYRLHVVGELNSNGFYVQTSNSGGTELVPYNQFEADSGNIYYYRTTSSSWAPSGTNNLLPNFESRDAGLAAVADWIENGAGGGGTPHSLSLSLPCGNAVYLDITGVSSFNLSLSQTTEVAQPQTFYNNQYYGYSETLPSSFSGNPSGSSTITWNGTGGKTLFNRYTSFYYTLYNASNSHKYLFIVNPYATIDEYNQSFNSTIYISIDNAKGYQYYELTGGIATDGTIGQQTNGTTASGQFNESTGQWETINNQTGQPWSPSEGGGNLITTNSVNDWLKTIATQLSNFFQGAIGAVTTLVSAGSDFIHSLSGLYSWLPAPVYSVLVSALILIITIGVIKVFI